MTVYFATNRLADARQPGGFGAMSAPDDSATSIVYGAADVAGGRLTTSQEMRGQWADVTLDAILSAGRPILVTIHGFDYTFAEAIQRAALLGRLYAEAGTPATVLAFTWPSAGRLIEFGLPQEAYEHDQAMAAASGPAIARFLDYLALLRANLLQRRPDGRIALLCHSMGNFALAGALDAHGRLGLAESRLFDQAVLAAADERCDSFSLPGAARLGRLAGFAAATSVYVSRSDAALEISRIVNGTARLGQAGPSPAAPVPLRLVDWTAQDPTGLNPDTSHQYYRTVPACVADTAALIAGRPIPSIAAAAAS